MKKQIFYTYLGTNGTITSPVHLEDTYYVRKVQLTAEAGKMLTKDNKTFVSQALVLEDEVDQWKEVKVGQK
jgi:hypothetical protein